MVQDSDQPNFVLEMRCFKDVSAEEKQRIMDERLSKNTMKSTNVHMKNFSNWLFEKEKPKVEDIPTDQLPEILEDFYCKTVKKDGELFKVSTLKNLRSGLNRYFWEQRGLDIVQDTRFTRTNEMFSGVKVQSKKAGKGTTKSYPVVNSQDMNTIAQFFQHDYSQSPNPRKLLRNMIYNILYFFCQRAHKNLYGMCKDHFKLSLDPDTNLCFVEQNNDEMDKNHGPDYTKLANEAQMYEKPGMENT